MSEYLTGQNTIAEDLLDEETVEENRFPDRDELLRRRRHDGRRVRTIAPMAGVVPFIMRTRNTSSNFVRAKLEVSRVDEYIREKRAQGYEGFNLMHIIIAAYVRTVAKYPALNRFIRGQRVWTRDGIEVMLVIKKEMSLDSPDTAIKAYLDPSMTAVDIYKEFDRLITSYRNEPSSDFDDTAGFLNAMPRFAFRFAVWMMEFLEYHNLLPNFLLRVSPFHGSMFITSMGSLGVPAIYHHLYDFGNVPVFLAFGTKYHENIVEDDGTVSHRNYVDLNVVMDERICDGYYYAECLKMMRRIIRNPWKLDTPPDVVNQDIK